MIKNDNDGNEFVWVPVDDSVSYNYNRYSLKATQPEYVPEDNETVFTSVRIRWTSDSSSEWYPYYFEEELPNDEKLSVEKYGGYYIGRYETGDKESTENEILRDMTSSRSNNVTIKKNQAPYNCIDRSEAIDLSNNLYKNSDYVISKLCSGYAWDTALKFIDSNTENAGYITDSEGGNYANQTINYIDIKGESKTKLSDSGQLIPTGQTTSKNNIYDMGGNVAEYTTESNLYGQNMCAVRGGAYEANSSGGSASYRSIGATDGASTCEALGFRIALYIK